ncbi:hypothetical protein EC968_004894 [Mortierella alpina]|nr:hypothetical protein EC968_004894 [Mortierella alpina]
MATKLAGFLRTMVPKVPLLIATTVTHYSYGPAKPSWPYRLSITVALLQSFLAHLNYVPVRESQSLSRISEEHAPIDPGAIAAETTVPNHYRDKAAEHLDHLLGLQGIDAAKLGWDWKSDPRAEEPLLGEWTEAKEKDEKHSDGPIDYRLAPDSPFPAALQDAMAAYLYLLHPPADSGASPVDPMDIVIMGDSAGGGLAFATMLAIRDAGLPMPAGVVGWSPWYVAMHIPRAYGIGLGTRALPNTILLPFRLDLLHSMPSLLSNAGSDYLPAEGFTQGGQASLQRLAKLAATSSPEDVLLHHPELPDIQYYASNVVLDCPYVSPLVAENFQGLCPMLVIAGDGEMLRDEAIVFAKRGAASAADVRLAVYDDMPHVFPMFGFLSSAEDAMQQSGQFIRQVTIGGEGIATSKGLVRVDVNGKQRPLEDDAVAAWETRVGKLGGGHEVLKSLIL